MYNHEKDSQHKQLTAWQEKMNADREANRQKYLEYALKAGRLEDDRIKNANEWDLQQENLRLRNEAAAREAERHRWEAAKQPDQQRLAAANADAAEHKAVTAQAEADNAPDYYTARTEAERQRGITEQTKQQANRSTVTKNQAAAGKEKGEFSAWDKHGREHKFRTKDAADRFAKQNGTFKKENKTENTSTTQPDKKGNQTKRTSTKTTEGGYAAPPTTGTSNRDLSRKGRSSESDNKKEQPI